MCIAILITARLKSTRLPLKALKPIQGRPMIGHMIDRIKLAQRPGKIILCTSTVSQDDPLEEIARQEGIECFRGDPDDVLVRLTGAARAFGVETIINCMADNPFTDPEYIDHLADFHIENNNDYSRTEGLPLGAFSYALSYEAMTRVCELKAEKDTEIWGRYFTDTGHFKWGTLMVKAPAGHWPELRLTVDTPEDFDLVTRIFDHLYTPGQVFPLRDIVAFCKQHPELTQLNAHVVQATGIPIKLKEGVEKVGD